MTVRCIDCGHEQPEGETQCQKCGHRFDGGYEGAFEDWSADGPAEDFYYTYEWFGVEHRIKKWRWDLGIVSMAGMGIFVGLIYLGLGWWANALIFASTMLLTAYFMHIIGKRKSSYAAVLLVGLLVLLPGIMLSSFPWHVWHEEYLEEKYAPKFSTSITFVVEGEAHIICDGTVTNYGLTGSRAHIEFKAFSGPSDDFATQFPDFQIGYVTTEWLAPEGGTALVHWECTLDYFNWGGSVTWIVEPSD